MSISSTVGIRSLTL